MPQVTAARIFARLMDWADPIGGPPANGAARYRVEWSRLDGPRSKGKFTVTLVTKTRNKLANDLVEALLTELNSKYPGENFSEQDLVMWGS